MRKRNVLGTVLILCSQLTIANTQVDKGLSIYQNSSAEIRIEQFSTQIQKQFSSTFQNEQEGNADVQSQILSAIKNTYQPKHFEKHILDEIDSTLNWHERKKIVQWLDTPLGRKASLAEALALMNANRNGINATIDTAKGLESASKAALVDIAELAAMESALQMDITVFQSSVSAFAANAPQSRSTANDYNFYKTTTESRRAEIATLNKNFSRSMLAIAYSDFSKSEVKSIISFWGSPTGTRYSVALRRGIKNAFDEANQKFNDDVSKIISASTLASSAG